MAQDSRADFYAELEQRVQASRRNTEEAMRRLDEVFYDAERQKCEIRLRQLQRRSRGDREASPTTKGTLADLMAQLHQDALEARIDDETIRRFNEAFDGAERRKRENERRLRLRLAELRAANGSAA